MLDVPIPVEFRSEVIRPVLKALAAGESCSLVGVGSSGKSNVARHLARYDVRAYHLGDFAQSTLSVLIDCTKLADYSATAIHSLMLEAIFHAALQAGPEMMALRPKLESMWELATETASAERTRHILENAIAGVLGANVSQVFLILDDFDHAIANLPSRVINYLRALRDDHKSHVMYATVTRRELAFLRDEDEYKDFYELVSPTTIAIGPYCEADANLMIDRLVARWNLSHTLNEAERQKLLEGSGCHAGLLKAIFRVTLGEEVVNLMSPRLVEKLRGHPRIEPECEEIWKSLEEEETTDLQALASQGRLQGIAVRRLERKGLIRARIAGEYEIFSPVFAEYVRDKLPRQKSTIELIPARQEVRLAGHAVKQLDVVEYRLLDLLFRRRGQPLTPKELIIEMLAGEVKQRRFPGGPEQRLDRYMSEIKRKVNSPQREYIVLDTNGCYQLVDLEGD